MAETTGAQQFTWKTAIASVLIIILIIFLGMFYADWRNLSRPVSAVYYQTSNPQELTQADFSQSTTGIPFWIWVVLPRLFPEKLPSFGGYTALGLTWQPGSQLPNGLTQEYRGVARVILDGANPPFDPESYEQFFCDCAEDPRFNPNFLLPEITYNVDLSLREKLLYRFILIPSVKDSLIVSK